jgi:hypothetical protein
VRLCVFMRAPRVFATLCWCRTTRARWSLLASLCPTARRPVRVLCARPTCHVRDRHARRDSANFVEEQQPGVFVKTLRNMWFAVSFFNPLISALGLFVLPMATIYDHPVRASGFLHTNPPRTDPITPAHMHTHARAHAHTYSRFRNPTNHGVFPTRRFTRVPARARSERPPRGDGADGGRHVAAPAREHRRSRRAVGRGADCVRGRDGPAAAARDGPVHARVPHEGACAPLRVRNVSGCRV